MNHLNLTFSFWYFKWNLICDRGFLGATLQSIFFAGMLIGSFLTGIISDAWGRKNCMFASMAITVSSKISNLLLRGQQVNSMVRLQPNGNHGFTRKYVAT